MANLLIVDDEKWIRMGIRSMINASALGVQHIWEAADAAEAFQLVTAKQPQVVLSDVQLPGEDGCSLCQRIYNQYPDTKIVMISAYDDFEYARRALAYQAVDYLLKPVDKQVLNSAVARCLAQVAVEPVTWQDPQQDSAARMEEAQHYLHQHYGDKLTLGDMAARYYMNEAYFSHLFKTHVGSSFIHYLTGLRVEKAQEMLATTQWKVVEIAQRVGYQDAHYFTKVFKKITGLSPTEYRSSKGVS